MCSLSNSKNVSMDIIDMDMDEILKSIDSLEPKTVDQVWKNLVEGRATNTTQQQQQHMTLEEFLTNKAGASDEHEYEHDGAIVPVVGIGIGVSPESTSGIRRRKRGEMKKGMEEHEPVLDKATFQKHKRMIKNRESAARSRERKQAYIVELESLVTQLEEENKLLLREQDEINK
ncbi:unnamed protein product [Lupinus luteus]|uniref:BZIP domain-containing protein n=1 Tax=Lupinus luteus TaxID=3873 RepID=A0AAV1WKH4_LUPLU